jgi:hypothetical protein
MGLSRSQLATVLCGGRKYICLVGRRYEILCSDSVLPVSLHGFRSTPILIRFSCSQLGAPAIGRIRAHVLCFRAEPCRPSACAARSPVFMVRRLASRSTQETAPAPISIDPVRIFKFALFPAQPTKFYFEFKLHRMYLQRMKAGRGLYRRSNRKTRVNLLIDFSIPSLR